MYGEEGRHTGYRERSTLYTGEGAQLDFDPVFQKCSQGTLGREGDREHLPSKDPIGALPSLCPIRLILQESKPVWKVLLL